MAKEIGEIEENTKLSSSAHNFPIVGIGASAGGLDAYKKLLEALPVDSGMAYVVVQHLNPAHESNLTEIPSRISPRLARQTKEKLSEFLNFLSAHSPCTKQII